MAATLRVGVIVGSTRPTRRARAVAEWICAGPDELALDLTVVDLPSRVSGAGQGRAVRPKVRQGRATSGVSARRA